jgi:hypothetical protein
MRAEERDALRRRFAFQCGYCGVSEESVGAELTVDHYQPRAHGGKDEQANRVYACFTCNNLKSDVWAPDTPHRILHPLNDNLAEHIAVDSEGRLLHLSETGRFHIEQLQPNRTPLVAYRLAKMREAEREKVLAEARHQQEELRRRIASLEAKVAEAEQRLRSEEGSTGPTEP